MELRHSRTLLRQKESETQTNDASYMKDKNMHDKIEAEIKSLMVKVLLLILALMKTIIFLFLGTNE